VVAVIAALSIMVHAAPPVPVHKMIFQDTFGGELDRSVWNPFITSGEGAPWNMQSGRPNPSGSEDRPNHFAADYDLPSFIHTGVPGTGLVLVDQKGTAASGFTWTGSAICSYPNKSYGDTKGFTFDNVYAEVCAKMPNDLSDGGWPAIWFMPAPGSNGGEIDLFEGGFTKGDINTNRIMAVTLNLPHDAGIVSQTLYDAGVNLSKDYHIYGMAYKPGQYLKCYLDGKMVASWTGSTAPTGSYYLIINNSVATAATTGWHSQIDASTPDSSEMDVKDVKVWELK
jgi:hypothetical protein